ncbi:hypothetical protein CK203_019942 [Vitis vinifera]|uniref:DUF4283 domain-containing protein n=1 Tax=Vitis vinifera TaxID=29760 RepID=A0A438J2Z4_VITVI|nr:hypothetical protein CK203_019942 [Vitis vinifera]
MELDSFRNWGKCSWNLRKGVKVMKLGEPFFLLEFEDGGEAERVLNRGTRRFKDKLLHLERWSEEAGCLQVDEDTKNFSQLQWARILVKNGGNFFPGTLNLVVKSFCYAVRLWWEVQPRVSAVEPMKKLRWSEGERVREEGDEGSCAGSSGRKEKERWRAAEVDGAGAVRKRRGKEKSDGDRMGASADGSVGYGKEDGGVGLSGKDSLGGLDSCKLGGQSSRGEEWAAHEGPSSFQRGFLGQVDNRGEEQASRVDHSFFQRDGLGHMDNRPKSVGEEGQPSLAAKYVSVERASDDGPSSFQKDGLGRLDLSPKVAGGEGQPNLATVWASLAHKPPWDEPGIKARASYRLLQAEEWFVEEKLVRGMGPSAARGTPKCCSIADECFLEEASRKPKRVECQPSEHVSGKEKLGEKSASGSFPLKEGRKERGEEEEKDMESWRYSCLAKFCHCLGMPTEGYESDIPKLLHKMRDRRDRSERLSGKKRKGQRTSRFDRELKKLEWSVNYSGLRGTGGIKSVLDEDSNCVVECKGGVYGPSVKVEREEFLSELGPSEGCGMSRGVLLGGMFTWSGGLNNLLKSRIDRFLISEDWEVHFQGCIQGVLARPVSDHSPIILDGEGMRRGPTPFRFENMWLKEEGFKEVLRKWWEGIQVTVKKQEAWYSMDFWDKEERVRVCL